MLTQQKIHELFNQGMLFFYNTKILGKSQSTPILNKCYMEIFNKGFNCAKGHYENHIAYYGTSKGYKMP